MLGSPGKLSCLLVIVMRIVASLVSFSAFFSTSVPLFVCVMAKVVTINRVQILIPDGTKILEVDSRAHKQ